MALSRPDISDSMLHRKREALAEAKEGQKGPVTVLTNCPSCVQGLGRNRGQGIVPQHLSVAVAERLSGKGWLEKVRAQVAKAHAVNF